MGTKDIETLLKRYYDGLTSEEEEAQLTRMLSGGDVPRSLKADQDFFKAMHGCKNADDADAIEQKIAARIDRWSATVGTTRRMRIAAMARHACAIAASVAVVALLGTYLHSRHAMTPGEREQLAMAQTALAEFSETLNKGLAKIEDAQEKTKDIGKSINKCVELNKNGIK